MKFVVTLDFHAYITRVLDSVCLSGAELVLPACFPLVHTACMFETLDRAQGYFFVEKYSYCHPLVHTVSIPVADGE